VKVIIFEGWCVGFRPLHVETLRWKEWSNRSDPNTVLSRYKNEDLEFVNERLRDYDCLWEYLDVFIHIDALDIKYVYDWRREQEDELRREKGPENAMTDEEVITFVDGYYPAYELYTNDLRKGVFQGREDRKGCQLRLQVGPTRRVMEKEEI
jgi:D-glycerate 3-kinase